MTKTTAEINAQLRIVKINDKKFKVPGGYVIKKGFAFEHPELGFFCWNDPNKSGHILPYTPAGGKKTLQEILNAGGILSFEDTIWMKEMIV